MDEQASVRLRSVENRASTAPSSIVTVPSISTSRPQAWSPGRICAQTISTPNTPVLVSRPESSAEAGAGATGCALGSQMCSGNMPALAPKPASRQPEAA